MGTENNAEAALISLVASPSSRPAPLDQELDGPAIRVYGEKVPVALRLGRATNGRLICTGVLIGWDSDGGEVTARDFHSVAIGRLLTNIARLAAKASQPERTAVAAVPAHPGPDGWDDTHFEKVAASYQEALMACPATPIKWMAKQWKVSPGQIHRWLLRARDKGMLPR